MMIMQQCLQMFAQCGAVLVIGQRKFDKGAKVRVKIADVKAPLAVIQPDAVDLAAIAEYEPDGVCQLDFAALAGARVLYGFENTGGKNIPRRNRQVAWRLVRARLVDHSRYCEHI